MEGKENGQVYILHHKNIFTEHVLAEPFRMKLSVQLYTPRKIVKYKISYQNPLVDLYE